MPNPIAIANDASSSLNSLSHDSHLSVSLGKDVSDLMDYSLARFSTSTESDATVAPSTSFNRLETTFCRNFTCCGQALDDLHDLLQHYEECHVRFEDDDLPSMLGDDDVDSSDSSESSSQPPSPRLSDRGAHLKRKADHSLDAYGDNTSAFDTAVMPSPISKKRSLAYYGPTINAAASSSSASAVHQSLRRALIDGGIGRNAKNQIYTANSPFTTPGSSMPGTPRSEDADFFPGASSSSLAFSSMSLRNNDDLQLPSCAPPNLFFPSTSSSSTTGSASSKKDRERLSASSAAAASSSSSILAGTTAPVAEKPFKCPEPGCDKAYKQMNGLKYHRLHGQCNQNKAILAVAAAAAAAGGSRSSPTPSTGSSSTPEPSVMSELERLRLNTAIANAPSPVASPGSECATPTSTAPNSPRIGSSSGGDLSPDKTYICQVGECGKRYKNLNGLRYHYAHSGSHGALGLALLQANGGGASAKVDSTGRPTISTSNVSSSALQAAAQAAAESQQQLAATIGSVNLPSLPLGPSPSLA